MSNKKKKRKRNLHTREKRRVPILPEETFIPDSRNVEELRKFFSLYKHLSTYEQARIVKRACEVVMGWKRKIGIRGESIFKISEPANKTPDVEKLDREIWDNKEWFEENYQKHGPVLMGKMTGLCRTTIWKRCKKYGIKINPPESSNKYCNVEWLTEHYINKNWSTHKCAEVAGVSAYTIMRWLSKFNLPIRGRMGSKVYR